MNITQLLQDANLIDSQTCNENIMYISSNEVDAILHSKEPVKIFRQLLETGLSANILLSSSININTAQDNITTAQKEELIKLAIEYDADLKSYVFFSYAPSKAELQFLLSLGMEASDALKFLLNSFLSKEDGKKISNDKLFEFLIEQHQAKIPELYSLSATYTLETYNYLAAHGLKPNLLLSAALRMDVYDDNTKSVDSSLLATREQLLQLAAKYKADFAVG